ncbi:hypothetical protein BC828DRAFT_393597 [Blastocladiella britannica]|nr:hypothetical protein BC828DRAFT_393597 [Blastocladiella britannica]
MLPASCRRCSTSRECPGYCHWCRSNTECTRRRTVPTAKSTVCLHYCCPSAPISTITMV